MITIGIDPTIELGPVTLAWHGLTIAIGLVVGMLLARHEARRRKFALEPLDTIALILILAAMAGARVFYLAEKGLLLQPSEWLGTTGFTFYGGFIGAAIAIGIYIWSRKLSLYYLDAITAAVPLGIAVGRIGDVINGEHYGPPTDSIFGVRNTHPEALTPSADVAYHSGGLYEVMLGLLIFAVIWPLRHRIKTPTVLAWMVVGLLALGRFVEFFFRSDSATIALGLATAQWTSLLILAVSTVGAFIALSRDNRTARGS